VRRPVVLVVDDDPGMLRTTQRVLEGDHRVLTAGNAAEALVVLAKEAVEVALLDVRMPHQDGFELLQQMRRQWPGVDVIMMTGSVAETDQKLVAAIEAGAFYFITKPFERAVLRCLVERCLQLRALDRQRQQRMAEMARELELARTFQHSLLPPERRLVGAYRIWSRLRPAVELSGDFVDHGSRGDEPWVFVADVVGHGAGAAMVTGIVKAALGSTIGSGGEPMAAAAALRQAAVALPSGVFFTFFLAWVDGGTLHYVNAGHPPGLWCGGGEARSLGITEPLASADFAEFGAAAAAVPFPAGCRLLLHTDGLDEARDPDGALFGIGPLQQLLASTAPEALLDAVLAAVDTFARGRPADDDHALLLLAHDGGTAGATAHCSGSKSGENGSAARKRRP
jgi:sigma-B regulation protein RsbU (phosphoserine phosphatase)